MSNSTPDQTKHRAIAEAFVVGKRGTCLVVPCRMEGTEEPTVVIDTPTGKIALTVGGARDVAKALVAALRVHASHTPMHQ